MNCYTLTVKFFKGITITKTFTCLSENRDQELLRCAFSLAQELNCSDWEIEKVSITNLETTPQPLCD